MMEEQEIGAFRLGVMQGFFRLRSLCDNFLQPVLQRYGLSQIGLFVLFYLAHAAECPTVGELYRELNLNQGNLSSLCKKLERDGLILKHRKREDERVVLLELTEQGRQVLRDIEADFRSFDNYLLEYPEGDWKQALQNFSSFVRYIDMIAADYRLGEQAAEKQPQI